MKKFICTALTLAMVVGSLAGCGSSSSKETTAASGARYGSCDRSSTDRSCCSNRRF